MKKKLKLIAPVLGGMLLIVLIPVQARAVAAQTPVSASTEVVISTSQLTVGAIDNKVAARAGNHVRVENGYKVLYDGATSAEIARVPIGSGGSPNGGTISPYGTITGNCGTSYIYLQNLNNLRYQFSTGFDLTAGSAYDFDWSISVTASWTFPSSGGYGFHWSDSGPMWPGQHWTSGWIQQTTSAPSGAYHVAEVTSGTAYRTDGVVCYAGPATAAAYIWY